MIDLKLATVSTEFSQIMWSHTYFWGSNNVYTGECENELQAFIAALKKKFVYFKFCYKDNIY